ncbi:RNA-directed DNA polymerase, eukaryota, reverse transcriptase zinc-binding domain protein [Tanacetum coccineum]
MEGLHNSFEEAVGNGMITRVNINNSTINVFHLFYADDVIITRIGMLETWIISSVLSMFSIWPRVSRLIFTSPIFMVLRLIKMKYLVWLAMLAVLQKTLVDRFHMRLSSWKANLLSIGGRLTLIKSVLGGLKIGSLKAFNLALLQKWCWGLLSSPNAIWVKVIKAYHGQEGGFDTNGCSFKGTWANIVGSSNFLHSKGIILSNTFRFKAGCDTRIRFWKDIWVGETPLFTRYNRLYHLDQDKDCLIIDRINNGQWSWNWSRTNLGVRNLAYLCDMLNEIGQLNIDVNEDTCTWSLAPNGTFTVKDARYRIDQNILLTLAHATTWDKCIPRKVNVFMWRLFLDRLPHILNLSSYGIDIPAISCPSCNANVESANYVFFECDVATDMWKLLLGILSMIGSSLGMLLKRKNTSSMLLLLRFFGGFGDTEIASRLTLNR